MAANENIPDVRQLSIPALPNNLLMHLLQSQLLLMHDVKSSDKETHKYFQKYLFKIII